MSSSSSVQNKDKVYRSQQIILRVFIGYRELQIFNEKRAYVANYIVLVNEFVESSMHQKAKTLYESISKYSQIICQSIEAAYTTNKETMLKCSEKIF